MTRVTVSLALLLLVVAVACSQQGSSPSSPASPSPNLDSQRGSNPSSPASPSASLAAQNDGPLAATIEFGRDQLGSPFPPPSGHDASGHSRDSLFPQTVVIDRGGTVTFKMGASGVHEAALYEPGITPDDIDTTKLDAPAAGCPPVPIINDPDGRIAIISDQVCEGGSAAPTWTFPNPGKYLVICTFLPHFERGMWGWVIVK